MLPEIHKNSMLEEMEKLVNSVGYMYENSNKQEYLDLQIYYRTWEDQVKNDLIVDYKLFAWIENQIIYWGEKDRGYTKYLENLLDKSTK
jgi:hypothetical protein